MDDDQLTRAIEDNAAELLMAMGAAGGGSQRNDATARWTIGGSPLDYHNAVVAGGPAAVPESVAELRKYGVPGSWHVGPALRSPELHTALLAAGFTHGGSEPGMALRLTDLRQPDAVPGLELIRVSTEAALTTWQQTLGQGFGEGEKEARWVASVYRPLGLTDPWRHYVAFLDGAPVGTITIYFAAGVAGVYFVMTVPEARRRGIGAALTAAALRQAEPEAQYAVLGSSAAGRSVYESLGFRAVCEIDLYELGVPVVDGG
ncbi:GNAT family N-acetyltransferase [Kribbella sandramycini]|uniref:GNAT family N-acetyltransferase n=1 Tax=Kribbella sandramycini TaxID=60450 RepID=A0A7Y4L4H0_9ACTN|nr:GNAT family N-acetyltransferase [Kribbella sandramycini]MBB6571311.1 GNAT superfamily N-acetyltransferase [Kribbella sandramycini]NOL43286.1 GNAT family N-acetyltransferase [Kribbella sandramycini]